MTDKPYGVLGQTLKHSYTPEIYRQLADIDYKKFEKEEWELESFLKSDEWKGINVTIPYKKTVMKYLSSWGTEVDKLGNVNTIIRDENGNLIGHNTDYFGFKTLIESLNIPINEKTALVFGGNGGAGSTCIQVLKDLGAHTFSVNLIGDLTYENMYTLHPDAQIIVNATPVGMYPNCPKQVAHLSPFTQLEGFIDIVYNPARTALMMEAESLGVKTAGGLLMLVAQAAEAIKHYKGYMPSMQDIAHTTKLLSYDVQNIALIGMPGVGKTTIGKVLAEITGKNFLDIDKEIEMQTGYTCSDIIRKQGEKRFRYLENQILAEKSKQSRQVISCGGGIVTNKENFELLHQNSLIVYLDKPLEDLEIKGRVLSKTVGLENLYQSRKKFYETWSDVTLTVSETPEQTAHSILSTLSKE